MKSYRVPALSMRTPKEERAKLVAALEGVEGVKRAILHADCSSFQIETEVKRHPTLEDLTAAASEAGFTMTCH